MKGVADPSEIQRLFVQLCPRACPEACDTHLIEILGSIAIFKDHLDLSRCPRAKITKFQKNCSLYIT